MKNTKKLLSTFLVTLLVLSAMSVVSFAAALPEVSNLKTYDVDDDEVNLKWSKVPGADGYQVYVYNDTTKKWKKLVTTSKTFFEAENLKTAKKYKFRVRAYDKKVSGTVYSPYAVISVATEPDEVDNVRVSAKTKTSVTFKWLAARGATGYRVSVYDVAKGKYVNKADVSKTTAKVSGLKEGTSYKFKVRAYYKLDGKKVYGDYSDVISVKTNGKSAVVTQPQSSITKASAESAALAHAGLQKNQVKFFECKLDVENGVKVYEIDFYYGGYEYEYEINAATGKIIKAEKERAN